MTDESVEHRSGDKQLRPLDTGSIDESLFIDSYAVLGMERLMHPVDMADWDLKITCERQLFVDDYLLATSKGLTRQLHQPAPYPQNPVMRMREHPWETTDGFSLFVGATNRPAGFACGTTRGVSTRPKTGSDIGGPPVMRHRMTG